MITSLSEHFFTEQFDANVVPFVGIKVFTDRVERLALVGAFVIVVVFAAWRELLVRGDLGSKAVSSLDMSDIFPYQGEMKHITCLVILSSLFLVSCERREKDGLEIKREIRTLSSSPYDEDFSKTPKRMDGGLFRAQYLVPQSFFKIYSDNSNAAADPFADPVVNSGTGEIEKLEDPVSILESAGVEFSEGASAEYDWATGVMTIVQTPDQLELIEAYIDSGCDYTPRQIFMRAEVFELPLKLATQALDSAIREGEHSPERDAIIRRVESGDGRLVFAAGMVGRSGQRVTVSSEGFTERQPSQDEKKKTKGQAAAPPSPSVFIFEADPILGADEFTVDINYSLEFQTQRDRSDELQHKVLQQVTIIDGAWLLTANWVNPGSDRMSLLFISVSLQSSPLAPSEMTK